MVVAVETAVQGITMWGDAAVSGLMLADGFVTNSRNTRRIAEIDKALEYTRKWRVTANVLKSAQ